MNDCSYYESLREELRQLSAQDLHLQTVIPVAWPAEVCAKRCKNKEFGLWEPVLKDGEPQPAITGKNPSFWRVDGTPQVISHARAVAVGVLLERIAIAKRLGKELGLAISPSQEVVSIDFATKNYRSV